MNYPTGVPSPYVMHQHPYPTRFHGGIWKRPEFGLPYVRQPFNVIRPSQMAGVGCGPPPAAAMSGVTAIGMWDTADGVFRRPNVDGGGVFNEISGLGAVSSETAAFIGGGVLAFGLVFYLLKKKTMVANSGKKRKRRRAPRTALITTAARAAADRGADVVTAFNADWSGKLGDLGLSNDEAWRRYQRAYNAERRRGR